jgi:F-type H+-transporting ATPase subunit delta
MTDALAVHYAQALADAVFSENSGIGPEKAIEQLRTAAGLFSGSADFHRVLLSPAVPKSAKSTLVGKIADQFEFSRLIKNFLMVIVGHRRTAELPRVVEAFELAVDKRLGFERAEIIAATELSAEQKHQVEESLARKSGKRIRPVYEIDPSLIGGVIARLGSREYDGSLRGRLDAMRRRLAAAS